MDTSTVDVVIATRGDRPVLLQEAVDSVYAQTYPGPIHLTVVYDCDEYPSNLVVLPQAPARAGRWIHNREQHGLARARNRGVAEGSAPLLAFLDDDDLWRADKITAQVEFLAQHEAIPLVGTAMTIVDQHGRETDRSTSGTRVSHDDLLRSRVAELHPSSFLMRRAAFDGAGGVDEELPGAYAEDYDLVLRMSRKSDLGMVADCLTVVRWTGGSYFFSRWQTIATALQYLLAKHPDLAAHPRGSARILGQIAFAQAAMGHRRDALSTMRAAARSHPREPRLVLAGLVVLGIPADRVQQALHRFGRGI